MNLMMEINSCRLCKGVKYLTNLYEIDGDVRLDTKASFCLDVELHPKDGYPVMVCRRCKTNVQKFYKFKQKCHKVEQELRSVPKHLPNTILEPKYDPSLEYNFEDFTSNPLEFLDNNFLYPQNLEMTFGKGDEIKEHNEVELPRITVIGDSELSQNYNSIPYQNNPSFQCDLCGKMYETNKEFKSHLNSHTKTKTFQCEFCPKSFTTAENRSIHTQKHFGIKPFVCEICGQSSTKKQDLWRHMRIHSDERQYECDICGRRFKRSGDLCTHIRTHTGSRPYCCKLCDKTYTSHSGLRKHVKTHG